MNWPQIARCVACGRRHLMSHFQLSMAGLSLTARCLDPQGNLTLRYCIGFQLSIIDVYVDSHLYSVKQFISSVLYCSFLSIGIVANVIYSRHSGVHGRLLHAGVEVSLEGACPRFNS